MFQLRSSSTRSYMKWLSYARCLALALLCTHLRAGDSTEQIFNKATEALRQNDFTTAEQGYLQVLRAEPGNLPALGNLGTVYSRTHRWAKAIDAYRRALALSPKEKGLLLNLGLAFLKQDNYAQALPYFQQLVTLEPGNAQARELEATCRIYSGDALGAATELEQLRSHEANQAASCTSSD